MALYWPEVGYRRIPFDTSLHQWATVARDIGYAVAQDPEMQAKWLQCEGTWFVGVDALPTDPSGVIGNVPLPAVITDLIGVRGDLHPAQLSITYEGYPRPRNGESDAGFRYRLNRDAAHMDGLLGSGTPKRRFLKERHDWILGLPLTETSVEASPLVVWVGSHHILQKAMQTALCDTPEEAWSEVDITDIYTNARNKVFSTCARTPLFTRPGEAVLLNPFLLHGVAPWAAPQGAFPQGRMVAYFRPETSESGANWIRQK